MYSNLFFLLSINIVCLFVFSSSEKQRLWIEIHITVLVLTENCTASTLSLENKQCFLDYLLLEFHIQTFLKNCTPFVSYYLLLF